MNHIDGEFHGRPGRSMQSKMHQLRARARAHPTITYSNTFRPAFVLLCALAAAMR